MSSVIDFIHVSASLSFDSIASLSSLVSISLELSPGSFGFAPVGMLLLVELNLVGVPVE